MEIKIEFQIECSECGKGDYYDDTYATIEDMSPRDLSEREDRAIDWFKNHGWRRDEIDGNKWTHEKHFQEKTNA